MLIILGFTNISNFGEIPWKKCMFSQLWSENILWYHLYETPTPMKIHRPAALCSPSRPPSHSAVWLFHSPLTQPTTPSSKISLHVFFPPNLPCLLHPPEVPTSSLYTLENLYYRCQNNHLVSPHWTAPWARGDPKSHMKAPLSWQDCSFYGHKVSVK